jgi:fucose 4-O-acetylase-like acetyltransferase
MARIELIDSLKGYAIVLVLLGHVIVISNPSDFSKSWLWAFIYAFHMPLLLFLSGYLVYQKPVGPVVNFIFKKSKSLLFPYFIWLFIGIFVVNKFILNNDVWMYLIKHLVIFDNIWFLPVLFISFLILYLFISFENFLSDYKLRDLTLLLFLAGYLVSWGCEPPVQGLILVRWFSPFVIIGYLAAERGEKLIEKKYLVPLASIIFILLLPSWSKYVIYFNASFLGLIIDFILAITGIIMAYGLMQSLKKTLVDKFLNFCGIYSLEIYLISNFVALILVQIVPVQFWIGQGLTAYITGTMVFLLISLLFAVILSYNKYVSLLLFGRWSWKNIKEWGHDENTKE